MAFGLVNDPFGPSRPVVMISKYKVRPEKTRILPPKKKREKESETERDRETKRVEHPLLGK